VYRTSQVLRVGLVVAYVGALIYYSIPGRPPLAPYLWRAGARLAQSCADDAGSAALWFRTRYWKAVRP